MARHPVHGLYPLLAEPREVVRTIPVTIIKRVPVETVKEVEVVKEVEPSVEKLRTMIREIMAESPQAAKEIIREITHEVPVEIVKETIREVPVERERVVVHEVPVSTPPDSGMIEAAVRDIVARVMPALSSLARQLRAPGSEPRPLFNPLIRPEDLVQKEMSGVLDRLTAIERRLEGLGTRGPVRYDVERDAQGFITRVVARPT